MRKALAYVSAVSVMTTVSLLLSTAASAQTETTEQKNTTTTTMPAPTTVVTPVQTAPAPVQAAPVVAAPVQAAPPPVQKNKTVITETHSENYMATIAKSVFFGALAGALVGGAIYFIDQDNIRPVTIAYWGAGGALVGAVAGVVQIGVTENRNEQAASYLLNNRQGARQLAFVPRLVDVRF